MKTKSVMLWVGSSPNHRALACRMAATVDVTDILIERRSTRRKRGIVLRVWDGILSRSIFRSISNTWREMQKQYSNEYPNWPNVRMLEVENIHSKEARRFIEASRAEVVAVSGTRMIKRSVLDGSAHRKILNFHTGLSPFVNGGPNCTNWCVAERKWHLIGNTIMWIDAGIDSGDLVATEPVQVLGTETLLDLHLEVMNRGHELYVNAVDVLSKGNAIPRINQEELGSGVTYYSRQWNAASKARMLINWVRYRSEVESEEYRRLCCSVRTVSLDGT